MDFFKIKEREGKRKNDIDIYPDFQVIRSKDLMIRGGDFYAVWDNHNELWSTDEFDVVRLSDMEITAYADKRRNEDPNSNFTVKYFGQYTSGVWAQFQSYMKNLSDNSHQLDETLSFANTDVVRTDYVSKRLPYPLEAGDISAYDEMMGVLYSPEEREKLEWALGAIVSGEARHIQKFIVLYGPAGAGKSTFLNIVQMLFEGYYTTFEAKALTAQNNQFATEAFKANPLVALQHDGDLSRIEDNTKLNSIVSHEEMTMNEKYKASYMSRINCFLFMGTNKPVKITDSKSGIIRRLIDVRPTGEKLSPVRYQELYSRIPFELGAIAAYSLERYKHMGKEYFSGYKPIEMMAQTDVFYNFIDANFDIFTRQNGASLKSAYMLYKDFCDETMIDWKMPRHKFREELKNYFREFHDRITLSDGTIASSYYVGFRKELLAALPYTEEEHMSSLVLDQTESYFDSHMGDMPAQYANADELPQKKWEAVTTVLADLDTTKLHYLKVPENHIVIDFDLKDENGEKSAELNLKAASEFPATYSEFSKGGGGVHLHYIWEGDPSELSRVYSEGIEVKVYTGNSSLRRRRSTCNGLAFSRLSSGLPLKEKKMIDVDRVQSEKGLRALIDRNLRKEIHPGTKSSVDFIHKILEDAYDGGVEYDVTDMRHVIMTFAARSSNQAPAALKKVQDMKFASEGEIEKASEQDADDQPIVFYDVEIFPNLFLINWKYEGASTVTRMINPSAQAVEELSGMKLVGFNCRRYDNHILYGAMMGYNNAQLYKLSQDIISGKPGTLFGEAYDLSYADVFDYASKKQGLKKWQIELGIHHKELGLPWDEPVPEERWPEVAEYCDNDVISTEAVHKALEQDFVARQVLADLSGLPVNASTQQHTGRIIFGNNRKPQSDFVYTDLSELFPGYTYEGGKSTYRGEEVGEGGYVYAEPGMYSNVAVLDVASMHPTSIEELELFGPYTKNFSALKSARIAIKRGDYDTAKKMLNGVFKPYLKKEEDAEALSYALKIVINIVYGLTSAKFDNLFRDVRNKDNIVAKRGALFMIELKKEVQDQGFQVVHIKTDSIKIPDATPEIIDFIMGFGHDYGYEFEHEATYEKFCLVNDAVYIAKTLPGRKPAYWEAVGAQFQHPYVFKTLFSKETLEFDDFCEAKSVTTAIYLQPEPEDVPMAFQEVEDYKQFIGKVGLFVPVTEGGGLLLREKEGDFHAVSGTKNYKWAEAETIKVLEAEDTIDMSYFTRLADEAVDKISKYGDFEWLVA